MKFGLGKIEISAIHDVIDQMNIDGCEKPDIIFATCNECSDTCTGDCAGSCMGDCWGYNET